MNVTDLTDPAAVAAYLSEIGTTVTLEQAEALAEDALDFDSPPAGAWTVLAHVAEHRGDPAGLERWTSVAIDTDPAFAPAVADLEYLARLREDGGEQIGAAARADALLDKLDHFHGRQPQQPLVLELVGHVLGRRIDDACPEIIDVAENGLFVAMLGFEGGSVARFEAHAGPLLPPAERAVLASWRGARHRHVRMVEQRRHRWTLAEVGTGEVVEAATLVETWWEDGHEGFVLVVPVDGTPVVAGEPFTFPAELSDDARRAMAGADPRAVARTALRWRVDRERRRRVAFCFPGIDAAAVGDDEAGLLDLVRSRRPDLAAAADGGDDLAEAELLLEAITAHRIITRRVLSTWDTADALLRAGADRDAVFDLVMDCTFAQLWERAA